MVPRTMTVGTWVVSTTGTITTALIMAAAISAAVATVATVATTDRAPRIGSRWRRVFRFRLSRKPERSRECGARQIARVQRRSGSRAQRKPMRVRMTRSRPTADDPREHRSLTSGETYFVIGVNDSDYRVVDDLGEPILFPKTRRSPPRSTADSMSR